MPSVVDQDVEPRNFLPEPTPKLAISLITDEYSERLVLKGPTFLPYIKSVQMTPWTEILPPHFEATRAKYTHLQNMNFSPNKLLEMPMVNVKVMRPFPNALTRFSGIEENLQRVENIRGAGSIRGGRLRRPGCPIAATTGSAKGAGA
jgi:hypothetical protein